jgi:hypothetical protein
MKFLVEMMNGPILRRSILVNSHKVVNFKPANGTFFLVLAASNTSCIVFARHVHAVLVVIVTDDARVWMCSLTHECCLYCANVSLTWSNLENCLVSNFKQQTHFPFIRESSPCSICCSHVFNIKFVSIGSDGCMYVGQMLVFREI